MSTQDLALASITQSKTSIKTLEDNVAFYEASEENLKSELMVVRTESTALGQLFNDIRAEVADFQELLGVRHAVI